MLDFLLSQKLIIFNYINNSITNKLKTNNMDYKKQIQNWTVELVNDFITIYKDGELVKAFLVKPSEAVDKYEGFIVKVKALIAKTSV